MNTVLYFHKIPAYFTHIIPTKLEVDGIKFPLQDEISLWALSKSYGHFKLRLVFFGLIKSKALIIPANNKSIHLKVALMRHKIPRFTLAIMAIGFPMVYKINSQFMAYAFLIFSPITYMMDALTHLVEIQETNPPA
ncbi:hypothetical protein G9H61_12545 [Aquirufa ecclesiirivi]|uniref:Uncharacterized protein n=1 Tax=Aquirufa ecclesiirivi TaxID=2715124 RepID=A0ABT4JJB0_9BACT|nr:hypothetical protein [Aquirufa ecclesiirivi]MCZ2476278.1 hypothetical protein [Aquirufa ecclesiirivi]NHC49324.1 hypothetical protein [Aquirufa ecclesiirivi]